MHSGRLAGNVLRFGRLLRDAGLPVGSDRIMLGLQALKLTGLESREDFRCVLAASLLDRADQQAIFDEAFERFWVTPDLFALSGPQQQTDTPAQAAPLSEATELEPSRNRRLAEAFAKLHGADELAALGERRERVQAASDRELLRQADFDSMSADEWRDAQRLITQWQMQLPRIRTRRLRPAAQGNRPDWRRIAAESARRGGDITRIARLATGTRPTPLVALVDVSGSMSRYSRSFLLFLHALANAERSTQAFLFGTRLTSVTRALRQRDPDQALQACTRVTQDWAGGTRIGASLHEFNLKWSRRVLGQNATVLLVTDGLERGQTEQLAFETERLSKSCHRLLWLNPLLRYRGFEPKAAGVRAIMPHVDAHLPVHNMDSLEQLSGALGALGKHPRTASESL